MTIMSDFLFDPPLLSHYLELKMAGASLGYDKTPYLWYILLIIQNEATI